MKCISILGHKYKARYHREVDPAIIRHCDGLTTQAVGRLCGSFEKITYVRDVCIRCGDTVELKP